MTASLRRAGQTATVIAALGGVGYGGVRACVWLLGTQFVSHAAAAEARAETPTKAEVDEIERREAEHHAENTRAYERLEAKVDRILQLLVKR